MKKLNIYIAHSLTTAPSEFLARMKTLRNEVRGFPGIRVLDFAWERGPEFNARVNVYEYDMECVRRADLVVAILDYGSSGTPMEIQACCQKRFPSLVCFSRPETKVSKIIPDCIRFHRQRLDQSNWPEAKKRLVDLPDPIQYSEDSEIVQYVIRWMRQRQRIRELVCYMS